MSEVACYFLEHTARARRGLRRYASSAIVGSSPCSGRLTYHNAITWIDEVDSPIVDGVTRPDPGAQAVANFVTDPRWPTACEACGTEFDASAEWQVFLEQIYRRTDTGQLTTLRDATPGAIWNAFWLADHPFYAGPDGRSLVVRLPNGHDWTIDGMASNCDAPCLNCGKPYAAHREDGAACRRPNPRPHKCWVRHGEPPDLHVDKNGVTCNAGAGSILSGSYHGFLHHGKLREC